jgi:toxin ParE1/3/4
MKRVIVSPAAARDLEDIWTFIAQDSVRSADRLLREIRRAFQKLASMPRIGHLREDLAAEPVRFWTVCSYHIVYRAETKPLQVLRVVHGARNIEGLF